MPIYEFKCLKCNEFIEMLIMNKEEEVKMQCPSCNGKDLERVLSAASFTSTNNDSSSAVTTQNRTCAGGSCSTLEVPGPTR